MGRVVLFLFAAFCMFPMVFLLSGRTACAEDPVHVEQSPENPCVGLLADLDRPTISDSACVAPLGHAVLELGFQHADVRGPGGGTAKNYPQAELRFGIPGRNEIKVLAPNYTNQRSGIPEEASSGLSATSIGFKHELGYNSHWIGSVETILTLPSGNAAFGSRGLGAAFIGIVNYAVNDHVAVALELGVNSQTTSKLAGGERFTGFISNFVATWQPMDKFQFYGEVFGQSKTGPGESAGYNFDGGVQYLLTRWWEVDLEEGVWLTGNLGGFTHYYGAGMGFLF